MTHRYTRTLFHIVFILLGFAVARPVAAEAFNVPVRVDDLEMFQVGNPRPVLNSLSPESALAGETVELVLLGSSFESGVSSFAISGSGVRVLRTLVISQFQLRVTIQIDQAAQPGKRSIRVINAPPGGGSSASLTFSVKPPPHPEPLLLRMSPSTAKQGDTLYTELSGRAFVPGQSFVLLEDGEGLQMDSVHVIDSQRIAVRLIVDELAQPGRRNLTVITPGPGGGKSQPRALMVETAPYPRPSQLVYPGEALERGKAHDILLVGRGIRDVSHVILPEGLRAGQVAVNPPAAISFRVDLPADYRSATLPVLLSNPRPGGGVSDTVHVPVLKPANNPPKVERLLGSVSLAVGETMSFSLEGFDPIFSDADGDTLVYRVTVDDMAVFAEIRGSDLFLRGNLEGRAVVTLVAEDNEDQAMMQIPLSVFVPIPNKAPTLGSIRRQEVPPNSGPREIRLRGITAGEGEEDQRLTVTATSSNTRLLPNPEVVYTSPNATGTLILRPQPGVTGEAVITVRVRDDGGTAYNGVNQTTRSFSVVVPEVAIQEAEAETPGRFRLEQNYPNPFNPTTTIEYTIGETSHVRLTIWDVTGRPVVRLVDKEQAAGTYRVEFTADKIPSGTYLYRLEAGNYTQTLRMSLVK